MERNESKNIMSSRYPQGNTSRGDDKNKNGANVKAFAMPHKSR